MKHMHEGMKHIHEGMILALRDGMLVDVDVRDHVDVCGACAAALDDARARARTIQAALSDVGMPADLGAAKEAVRRRLSGALGATGAEAAVPHPLARSRGAAAPRGASRRTASPSRHLGRAAAILLLFAGAAAAALPGSPVREWIGALVAPSPAPAAVEQTPQAAPPESGIAVNVRDGQIQVVVRGAMPGSLVEVVWVDAATAAVTAADGSTFTYRDGYVEVYASPGDLRVELPRWARMASVEVDGRIYVRRFSGDVEIPGPSSGTSGDRIRFVVPGP
jgi:hypothetical protein